jgi:hypothetical protein
VSRSALATGLATAFTVAMMFAANRLAGAWLALPGVPLPSWPQVARLAVNLLAVCWTFAAGSLALAAHARKRGPVVGTLGIALLLLFLLHFAAPLWPAARPFDPISPFHYYAGLPIVMGVHDPVPDILVLLGITAALTVWAYAAYARRDL